MKMNSMLASILLVSVSGTSFYAGGAFVEQQKNIEINKLLTEKADLTNKYMQLVGGNNLDSAASINGPGKISEVTWLKNIDLESDTSLQKFVTSGKGFNDEAYTPGSLVTIESEFLVDAKGGESQLREEANIALQEMAKQFKNDLGFSLVNVSAYRSFDYQKGIENGSCPPIMCARAGFSEHQSGLAIDFFSASNAETWNNSEKLQRVFVWLQENAHTFGFHNSYQRGAEIDGYVPEPWHWRYVGSDFATYLKNRNITFAEYYKEVENNKGEQVKKYNIINNNGKEEKK